MALPPGVPSGARKLVITSLLTPACFWGHEEFDKCKSRDIEKLDLLERELSRVYRNSKFGDEQHYIPVENELVAVFDPIRKLWVRGRVIKWKDKVLRGEIFLVDYGSHLSDVQLVRPLPPHAHEIKYQAVQVFLYGVLPLTGQYDHKHGRFNQSVEGKWVAAAVRKVQDLLSQSIGFYFTCCRCWGEALLGDLFIHREDESRAISLTKALIDEKLAVYDYNRFNNEIDTMVGKLMLSSSRGEELRTVCMAASTTFATIAQQYRDPAPPLKELGQLSANYKDNDNQFSPAGLASTSLQPPSKHSPVKNVGPRNAQCSRENVQQMQGPPRGNHSNNDRQMQGLHKDGANNFQNRNRSGPEGRDSYVGQRDDGRAPPMDRGGRFENRDSFVGQREGGRAPSMGRGERFENRDSYVGQRDGGRAPPMDRGDRFENRGSFVGQRDGGRAPPMGRGERFENRDSFVGQRDGGRAPPMGRGERFENKDNFVGQRDGGRAPPMGRGERFENRDSFVGQRDKGRAPPMGRGERFENRDSFVSQRDGGRAPPMGRGEHFENRDSFVGQRDGGRAPPMGRGERFENRDSFVGQRDKGRAPPMSREDEEVRRLTMGRDNQRKELKSPPRRGSQFSRDADMAGPSGQHSSNNQPGPYGDANGRRGPRNSRSPPPHPHELPSRSPDILGISKLQVQERPSSMLTQLTGPNSQDAETVYKKPQPTVQGPPQKAHTAQTQSSGPATQETAPDLVNIEQDATKPVPPAPVNKYANRGFGAKKRTGSNSNSSSNSSKEEPQWLPSLLNMNHPQLPVLVQGCDLSKPLDSLSKAPLHSDIHRTLEQLRVTSLTIQQKHMLPAIFRGQNVVSVGPADSGKTLGFIIPLASSMLDPSKYIEMKDMFGPLVLILCADSERATLVHKWFLQLTLCDLKDYVYSYNKGYKNTKPRVKVLLTYGGGAEKEKLMELFNGCHVLISTPPCILRMLSFWPEVLTNFNRLCHLVFDDADVLFEKFDLQVGEILKLAQQGILANERKGRHLETIVTAKRWTESLEQFSSRVLTNPTIIINTGLEVMAYSRVVPSLHLIDIPENRTDVLTEIVKGQELPFKMLVACTFQYEVIDTHRAMQSRKTKEDSMLLLMAHESINQLGLISIKEKWESNSNVVLLVSDTVLSEMDIMDASVLVHFSMTDQRSYFNTRMSTIIKRCPNRFGSPEEQRVKPQAHMLIIEQDTVQIPVLLELMRRLKAPIPDILAEREQQENVNKEDRKKQLPLCDQLCCFGTCKSPYACPYRHSLITEMDKSPQYIPQTGEVKLKPLTVHNATHFSAQIEGHRTLDGKYTPTQIKEHVYLPIEMAEHFSIPSNRRPLGINVAVGTICAVETNCNLFQRVRIISMMAKDKHGNFTMVRVKSLDEGWWHDYKVYQLYHLPEKLQRPVPQAVDIHFCRLKTRDDDPRWSEAVNEYVMQWFSEVQLNESKGYFFYGKIVLSLAGRLWLDPMECRQNLEMVHIPIIMFSIRSRMLEKELALDNPEHITKLRQMCKDAGIELPDYSMKGANRNLAVRQSDETLKPSWAFFSSDIEAVHLITVDSPSSFFVQRKKHQGLLDHLINDICNHVSSNNVKGLRRWVKDLKPGSHVLGINKDRTWNRAVVEEILNEVDGHYVLQFVDFGDRVEMSSKSMLRMPDELLSKLPFQAIECTMAGISPVDNKTWSKTLGNMLQDLSCDACGNPKNLLVKVVGKTKSTITGGWRYAVKLFDMSSHTEVNQSLVESNLAAWDPDCGPEQDWSALEEAHKLMLSESKKNSGEVIVITDEDLGSEDEGKVPAIQLPSFPEQEEEEKPVTEVTTNPEEVPEENVELDTPNNTPLDENDFDFEAITNEDCLDFLSSMSPNCPLTGMMKSRLEMLVKSEKKEKTEPKSNLQITELVENEEPRVIEIKSPSPVPIKVEPTTLIMTAFEPSVVWNQDDTWVTLKINLPGVEKYDVTFDKAFIDFKTECGGRVYFFSKNLFGYINPRRSKHSAKGLYVELKLYKLVYFPWPRLERSLQGSHKTTLDMDLTLNHSDSDDSDGEWGTPKWEARNKIGREAIAKEPNQIVLHDVSDNDDGNNSDEEPAEKLMETFDPFDPLC